jgi:hypothetical protein
MGANQEGQSHPMQMQFAANKNAKLNKHYRVRLKDD